VARARLKTCSPRADDQTVAHPKAQTTDPGADRRSRRGDRGVVLVSTLAKVALTIAVVGTIGYDAISIGATHLQTEDHAQQAAVMGRDALVTKKSQKAAYAAVVAFAKESGDTLEKVVIGKDGTVAVTLSREARTIAASRVPRVKDYVVYTATAVVGDPLKR
jgi:hypothetical protein